MHSLKSSLTQKSFDSIWLENTAKDDQTKEKLKEIFEWNKEVEKGKFRESDRIFKLNLNNHTIWMRESEAWFSLHLYSHIFKDHEHMEIPEFNGDGSNLIIDLGANIGLYTLAIKDQNPSCKIIAIEPNPLAYELLQKNISANNLKEVYAMNNAVAENSGLMSMKILRESSAFGGKYLGMIKKELRTWIRGDRIKEIPVESVTLVDIFERFNIQKADILKMDIEGMEFEAFRGSIFVLDKIDKIVIEWHDFDTKAQILDLLLGKYGFSLVYEEPRDFGNIYFKKK